MNSSEPRHIYRCTFGSRLYGTSLPTSDYDTKGVFLPSRSEILRCHPPKTWTAPTQEGHDNESYSVKRYLELLAQGQTVALDMFFAPGSEWQHADPWWLEIQKLAPNYIINKRCGAAIGYARAQAEKYSLRGSRMVALRSVLEVLKQAHPHTPVQDALFAHGQELTQLPEHVAKFIRLPKPGEDAGEAFLEVCGKKVGIFNTCLLAIRVWQRALDEYGERSREAEVGGADWKALYHAVRITEQTIELLQVGQITFPRWNAADLLKIRAGEYRPEEIYDRIERGITEIEAAQASSSLPDEADHDIINKFIEDIHLEIVLHGN